MCFSKRTLFCRWVLEKGVMASTEMIWITRTSCLRTRRGMSMRRLICLLEHVCGRRREGEVLLESGSDV